MNKTITTRATAAVIAIAMLAVAAGCGAAPEAADPAVPVSAPAPVGIPVTAAAPSRGDLELTTSFVGSIQPDQVVSVMPKMMGTVKEVKVTTGQTVKKGDVLMVLDDKDLQIVMEQAQSTYDATKAKVDQSIGSGFKSQLATLDGQVDNTSNAYEDAKYKLYELEEKSKAASAALELLLAKPDKTEDDLTKIADLQKSLVELSASISTADQMVDRAKQMRDNARNSYHVTKIDGEAEAQIVADTTMQSAEMGLKQARQQLDNTKVTSPIDGVVETISVSELNMASTSAPAFVISNKAALSVSFNVPSASIAAMQVGGAVTVQKSQATYSATITEVNTAVSQQTGLFTVKASLETAAPELLTGVMVKVTAATQKATGALLLAQDSVYFDNGEAYVYLATPEGSAKKVFIQIGISTPEQVEVLSGITADDLVVTSWHPNLIDGAVLAIES